MFYDLFNTCKMLGEKTLILYCLFAISFAWLPPERCAQGRNKRSLKSTVRRDVNSTGTIEDIANNQHDALLERYKDYQFVGVPIRARAVPAKPLPEQVVIRAPYNCTFYTYRPRLLSSVTCGNSACKLSHTVTTTDTYTASEGYNWGVKISAKLSLKEVFDIGGEASTGGTYTCAYNKGKITADLAECSDPVGGGHLQLYTVKSDMICDFGEVTLEIERREGNSNRSTYHSVFPPNDYLTTDEMKELKDSTLITLENKSYYFFLDTEKVSEGLLQKFKNIVPLYDPHTDLLVVNKAYVGVVYYKRATQISEYKRIVPFTNEGGDSVYQYACMKTSI